MSCQCQRRQLKIPFAYHEVYGCFFNLFMYLFNVFKAIYPFSLYASSTVGPLSKYLYAVVFSNSVFLAYWEDNLATFSNLWTKGANSGAGRKKKTSIMFWVIKQTTYFHLQN